MIHIRKFPSSAEGAYQAGGAGSAGSAGSAGRYGAAPAPQIPTDVLWLMRGTRVLLALLVLGCVLLAIRAFMLAPWFSIQRMTVTGPSAHDVQFHNEITLRTNIVPQLRGNYFTMDLQRVQQQFESLPWIRSAVVQRVFPNQLAVMLTAHVPVARWGEDADDSDGEQLVNAQGEIFEAVGGPLVTDNLPQLLGDGHQALQILTMHRALERQLAPYFPGDAITQLGQSPQGLWRAQLASGATLQLGAGSASQVMARTERWLVAMSQVKQHYGARALQSIDLRYESGFAMQLAGVVTRRKQKT